MRAHEFIKRRQGVTEDTLNEFATSDGWAPEPEVPEIAKVMHRLLAKGAKIDSHILGAIGTVKAVKLEPGAWAHIVRGNSKRGGALTLDDSRHEIKMVAPGKYVLDRIAKGVAEDPVDEAKKRRRKHGRSHSRRSITTGWWGGYWGDSGDSGDGGGVEESLNEFSPGGGGSEDILKTLARDWVHGDAMSGDLDSDIQSQEQVERRLQRGIICSDGVKRSLNIDWNSDYDGVVIFDDNDNNPWSVEYNIDRDLS